MKGKKRSITVKLLLLSGITSAAAVILVFPSAAAGGIADGMKYSAEMLIPSLFPFMVISSFLIRSGASDILGKLLAPVTKSLFRLPEESAAAIVMSFVGGFPVGAKCIRLLYDSGRIDQSQAERMMLFCVCSGPGFLVTGVGGILLHNTDLGWILYFSQLVSGVLIGISAGLVFSKKEKRLDPVRQPVRSPRSLTDSFIEACSDGANSVLLLTAMVTFFTMLLSLLSCCGATGLWERILSVAGLGYPVSACIFPIVFEVTGACRSVVLSGGPLWLLSIAVGFGGMCVHFQIFSVLGGVKINKLRYFLSRIINAILSSVIVYIVCGFYCPVNEAFAVSGGGNAEMTSVSAAGSAALVIMCVVFALSLRRKSRTF